MRPTIPTSNGEGADDRWIVHGPLDLVADPTAAAASRAFVAELGPSCLGDLTDTAVLLVSELVTNVVRHTRCESLSLSVLVHVDVVRVEVGDCDGARFPHVAPMRPAEPGGFGLRLVDALSSGWGATPTAGGKCVWFDLPSAATPSWHA